MEFDLATMRTLTLEREDGKVAMATRKKQLLEMEEVRAMAALKIQMAQEGQKRSFDKKLGTKSNILFGVGDLVMIFDAIHYKRVQKKFLPRYFGPYRITKVYSNYTYDVEGMDGKPHDRVNFDKLKLFHERKDD